eukprot:SAG11_NODE_7928_length_1080_cov_1.207951_1_plen_40_part_10
MGKELGSKQLNAPAMMTFPAAFVGLPFEGAANAWDDIGWL